jgi:hypothetical protein
MQRCIILFVIINVVHVSSGFSVHHQELKSVHAASGICLTCLLLPLAWMSWDSPNSSTPDLSSWWWAENLLETCRALTVMKSNIQRCILLVMLKNAITMPCPMNIKQNKKITGVAAKFRIVRTRIALSAECYRYIDLPGGMFVLCTWRKRTAVRISCGNWYLITKLQPALAGSSRLQSCFTFRTGYMRALLSVIECNLSRSVGTLREHFDMSECIFVTPSCCDAWEAWYIYCREVTTDDTHVSLLLLSSSSSGTN